MIGGCRLTTQNINGTIFPENGKAAARGAHDRTICHMSFVKVCSCTRRENIPSAATSAANIIHLCEEFIDYRASPPPVFTILMCKNGRRSGAKNKQSRVNTPKKGTCINEKLTI